MSLPLFKNLARFKSNELTICQNYGKLLSITNFDGYCNCTEPGCVLDTTYKVSRNSGCRVCKGKYYIPVTSQHAEWAVVKWISQTELTELNGAGGLSIGDCKLEHTRTEALTYFNNALQNKIILEIDGSSMVVTSVNKTILGTSLEIYLSKYQPRSGTRPT